MATNQATTPTPAGAENTRIGNSNTLPTVAGSTRAEARRKRFGTKSQANRRDKATQAKEAVEAKARRIEAWIESQLNPFGV